MRFQLASGVQHCNAASLVENARLKQSNDLFLCSTHALHPRHAGSLCHTKCIAAPHGSRTTFILGWVSGIQLDKDRCIGNLNMRTWLLLAVLHPRAEMRMEASKRGVRLLVSRNGEVEAGFSNRLIGIKVEILSPLLRKLDLKDKSCVEDPRSVRHNKETAEVHPFHAIRSELTSLLFNVTHNLDCFDDLSSSNPRTV